MMDPTMITQVLTSINFTELCEMLKYKGFDPKAVQKHLESCANTASLSQNDFLSDLKSMIMLFLAYGSNIDSIPTKISETNKKQVIVLKARYKLVSTTRDKSNDAINLGRVATAYPMITVKLLSEMPKTQQMSPISYDQMNTIIEDFPIVLMFTGAASLISNSNPDKDVILNAIKLFTVHKTKKINERNMLSMQECIQRSEKYVELAYKSTDIGESDRSSFFKTGFASLFDDVGTLKESVTKASDCYEALKMDNNV